MNEPNTFVRLKRVLLNVADMAVMGGLVLFLVRREHAEPGSII
jgi:hypothetical protein